MYVAINDTPFDVQISELAGPVTLANGDVATPCAGPGKRASHALNALLYAAAPQFGPVAADADQEDDVAVYQACEETIAKLPARPARRWDYEHDASKDWDRRAAESLRGLNPSRSDWYELLRGVPATPEVRAFPRALPGSAYMTMLRAQGLTEEAAQARFDAETVEARRSQMATPGTVLRFASAGKPGAIPEEVPDEVIWTLVDAARAGGLTTPNVERNAMRDRRIKDVKVAKENARKEHARRLALKAPAVVDYEAEDLAGWRIAPEHSDADPVLKEFLAYPRNADGSRSGLVKLGLLRHLQARELARFGSPYLSLQTRGVITTTVGERKEIMVRATRPTPMIVEALRRANREVRDGRAIERSELKASSRSLRWLADRAKEHRAEVLGGFSGAGNPFQTPLLPIPQLLAEWSVRSELQPLDDALESLTSGVDAPAHLRQDVEQLFVRMLENALAGGPSALMSPGVRVVPPTIVDKVVATVAAVFS